MDDLISRQQAIDAIMGEYPDAHYPDWYASKIRALPSAQPEERTGERTETHACDLISRQAAIDALARIAREKFNLSDEYGQYLAGLMDAQVEIEKLPSVQPEQKWSLCSERMPEEREWIGTKRFGTTISDEVYVTFESPKGERFCKHLSFQNGKLSAFDKSTIDAFYKGSKAIAWMPLPKPYREGGTT